MNSLLNTQNLNKEFTPGFTGIAKGEIMMHTENFFNGLDNYKIYYQKWSPKEKPKAVILIAHGYAEHSGRYMNVVNHFIPY